MFQTVESIVTSLARDLWLISDDGAAQIQALNTLALTPNAEQTSSRPLPQRTNDGTAVLNVRGIIVTYHSPLVGLLGWSSTDSLMQSFAALDKDPEVNRIVLSIDSPGGMVAGLSEFAEIISRSKTNTTAVVSGVCASAAYWVGSQCDEIIASPTSIVGNIGVKIKRPYKDTSVMLSKGAPRKILSNADMQTVLDDIEAVFISAVATGRGVTPEHVRANFGRGGVFVGAKAVQAGLADRVGSFSDVLNGNVPALSGQSSASNEQHQIDADWDDIVGSQTNASSGELDDQGSVVSLHNGMRSSIKFS